MRRFFILALSVFLFSLGAKAQIEVKQGSFKEVEGFVNISDKQYDVNGTQYAVIKVRTENITDKERRELKFDGDANNSFELEYKDGEVWVYITYLASQLKISHPEFGLVKFEIPFEMKPKCGYEMLLVNKIKAVSAGWGSLTVTTKPEDGATISLNGKVLKVKTPYSNNMIAAGTYEIKVSREKYQTVTKTVEIADGANEIVEIEMPLAYGSLKLVTEPAGVTVFIDGVNRGTTPIVLDDVICGNRKLILRKTGSMPVEKDIFIEENKLLELEANLETLPEGALNGLFTINANGGKVVFSKGNLQYHPKQKIWRFAEHQWDFVGEDNVKRSRKYDGWVDLYGWGTGNNPTTTSHDLRNYFETPFYDWAEHKISNGGDEKNQWRTMTKNEWDYLLNKRETASGLRYAKAEVNGVNGVVLLPDDWPAACYDFKKAKDRYDQAPNKISLSEWQRDFEIRGAVFLPAAGGHWDVDRYGGNGGYYWVSSGADVVKFDVNTFHSPTGNYDLVEIDNEIAYDGCSVRPARDIKNF